MQAPATSVQRISQAETTKLIRAALKRHFPGVKFSVKQATGSMVSAVDIAWTDGPSAGQVKAQVGHMVAGAFDTNGDDCYTNKAPQPHVTGQGELVPVRYELDSIDYQRHFSGPYCFAIGQSLDLTTAPTLAQQLDSLLQRYQGEATIKTHEATGNVLFSSGHHLAQHDFRSCQRALEAQSYGAEVDYDAQENRHFLAIYSVA